MRKIALLLILSFTFLSCSNDDDDSSDSNTVVEYFSINNNEIFEYDLGNFGDEDGAQIATQASHFLISELNGTNNIVYTYKASEGYVGTDFVRIELTTGSDGSSSGTVSSVVEIRFNVTE
jgi:hypothetical protein